MMGVIRGREADIGGMPSLNTRASLPHGLKIRSWQAAYDTECARQGQAGQQWNTRTKGSREFLPVARPSSMSVILRDHTHARNALLPGKNRHLVGRIKIEVLPATQTWKILGDCPH